MTPTKKQSRFPLKNNSLNILAAKIPETLRPSTSQPPSLLPLLFSTHLLQGGHIGGTVPMEMASVSGSRQRNQHLDGFRTESTDPVFFVGKLTYRLPKGTSLLGFLGFLKKFLLPQVLHPKTPPPCKSPKANGHCCAFSQALMATLRSI